MDIEKLSTQKIASSIYLVRGHKAMLDTDLASLYGVETKYLKRQVKRNTERFPQDFMFLLTRQEVSGLRCQIGTLERLGRGQHSKYLPYAFTEHGILMLSILVFHFFSLRVIRIAPISDALKLIGIGTSVLNSKRAVQVNIAIMRAFVKLREILSTNKALAHKFSELERKVGDHDEVIRGIVAAIRKMMAQATSEDIPKKPKGPIGFHP